MNKAALEARIAVLEAQLALYGRLLQSLQWGLEDEQERYGRVASELNGLLAVIRHIFGFQVSSRIIAEDGEPLWDAVDLKSGAVLVSGERDVVAVYDQAIRAWLAKKSE